MNKFIEREEKVNKIMMLADQIGDVDKVLAALSERINDFDEDMERMQYDLEDLETSVNDIDLDDYVRIDDFDDCIDYTEIIHGIGTRLKRAF